jgi:hypothetical protein
MNRIGVLLAFAAALFAPGISAQPDPTAGDLSDSECPRATTLDQLTKALDDAVSGPGNKDRTCLRALLLPGARLTPLIKSPIGSLSPHNMSVDDWIKAVAKRGSAEMYERQVKVTREEYGHMAQLWSEYETRPSPEGKATVHGVNSIQAFYDGSRWRVLAVLWESDATAASGPESKP